MWRGQGRGGDRGEEVKGGQRVKGRRVRQGGGGVSRDGKS